LLSCLTGLLVHLRAQASLYNIARSLYSVSDAVRNLDFFTPIFDEVAPYAARALGKVWDALGKVSPRLQEMAINAANRVLQTAPNVAYPSSFVNIGLRWLIGSDIGFFIGSQIGKAIPVSLGPGWSSTYNEWFKAVVIRHNRQLNRRRSSCIRHTWANP